MNVTVTSTEGKGGSSNSNNVLPVIRLYKHDDFGGDYLELIGGQFPNVGEEWNDEASSAVVISGTWTLYEHEKFGGRKLTLAPGVYRSLEDCGRGIAPGAIPEPVTSGWNDTVTSAMSDW